MLFATCRKSAAAVVLCVVAATSGCDSKPPVADTAQPKTTKSWPQKAEQKAVNFIGGDKSANRRGDVIFIHGLDGDAFSSWHPSGKPDVFWPQWVAEDNPELAVWTLKYDANSSEWFGGAMPIEDRARNLLGELTARDIGKKPTIIIAHSLGGLIAKQLLNQCFVPGNEEWETIGGNVQGVVFLATPHTGSDLASLTEFVDRLAKAAKKSVLVDQLKRDAPMLRSLNYDYRKHSKARKIETLVYFEGKPIENVLGTLVVPPGAADPGLSDADPLALDEDHITIAKPIARDTQLCLTIDKFIKRKISAAPVPDPITFQDFSEVFARSKDNGNLLEGVRKDNPFCVRRRRRAALRCCAERRSGVPILSCALCKGRFQDHPPAG
jgi:pimeloyl-ACP methyl ester carboxylesterase